MARPRGNLLRGGLGRSISVCLRRTAARAESEKSTFHLPNRSWSSRTEAYATLEGRRGLMNSSMISIWPWKRKRNFAHLCEPPVAIDLLLGRWWWDNDGHRSCQRFHALTQLSQHESFTHRKSRGWSRGWSWTWRRRTRWTCLGTWRRRRRPCERGVRGATGAAPPVKLDG